MQVLALKAQKTYRRYFRDVGGNLSIIMAVFIFTLVIALGVAVDYSRLKKEQQNAQDTVDNAALAAAVLLSREANLDKIDVKEFVRENMIYNKTEVFGNIELLDGRYDPTTNEIIVEARVEVPAEFMGIVGKNTLKVDVLAASGPVGVANNIDVVLVLDNTDSIGYLDLIALVQASDELVDYLHDNRGTANIRIGVVPFSRFVNVGTSNIGANWIDLASAYNPDLSPFEGCVHPYFDDRDGDMSLQPSLSSPVEAAYDYAKYPYSNAPATAQSHPLWWKYKWDTANCNLSEITPLSSDRGTVKNSISQIAGRTGGSTYIPSGLKWGFGVLQETAPISSSSPPNRQATKVMVLMTDGGNKLYWIRETESPENIRTDEETDAMTKRMCDDIKAAGIHMMTVGFKFDETQEEFARAADIMNSCASSSGSIYNPQDRDQLKADFKIISEKILEEDIRLLR